MSNFAVSTNSANSSKSSFFSPGKPTIKLVLKVTSGISFLSLVIKSVICCLFVFLFILFKILSDICWIGISKYFAIFSLFFTISINSSFIPSGYEYKNLIHLISGIADNCCNNSASLGSPYKSSPYLVVSCAITISSLIPLPANILASSIISSILLLTNGPLIYGIAQYVHLLLQPSAILIYEYCSPVVITLFIKFKSVSTNFTFSLLSILSYTSFNTFANTTDELPFSSA